MCLTTGESKDGFTKRTGLNLFVLSELQINSN